MESNLCLQCVLGVPVVVDSGSGADGMIYVINVKGE